MHTKEPSSPMETPTTPTPRTPTFPSLPHLMTSFDFAPKYYSSSPISPTSALASAANSVMRRRNSSVASTPTSPLQTTVQRPLFVRPAKMAKTSSAPLRLHTTSSSSTMNSIKPSRTKPKRTRSPPPKYHVSVLPRERQRSAYHTPAYTSAITHLTTPLVPLISVTSGLPHPQFPNSLLQYHLLTHAQLDDLALFYHQTRPACGATWRYPSAMTPWVSSSADGSGSVVDEGVSLEIKRRRWGRFIGLRGCESPVEQNGGGEAEEGLVDKMERKWTRALEEREEEERVREKGWRGRW